MGEFGGNMDPYAPIRAEIEYSEKLRNIFEIFSNKFRHVRGCIGSYGVPIGFLMAYHVFL